MEQQQNCCYNAICECFSICVCVPSLLSVLNFFLTSHFGFFFFSIFLFFISVFLFICHYHLLLLFPSFSLLSFFSSYIFFPRRFLLWLLLYNALKMSKDLCCVVLLLLLWWFNGVTAAIFTFIERIRCCCTSSVYAYNNIYFSLLTLYRNKSQQHIKATYTFNF